MGQANYIIVDLDGTLVRSDLFVERLIRLLAARPWVIFQVIGWLLRGIAFAKAQVAAATELDPAHLPYDQALLVHLRAEKAEGRTLVLATAAYRADADAVAGHLGLFDHVLATEGGINLKASRKLAAIKSLIGDAPFIYAGDSAADAPLWRAAAAGIFVAAPRALVREAEKRRAVALDLPRRQPLWRAFVKSMRPVQFIKNTLVFVPVLTAHEYGIAGVVAEAILAFACFCLLAAGVYFINDLIDLPFDRRHARKCLRPLPAGDLPLRAGLAGAVLLPATAFALALWQLPLLFTGLLAAYFLLTSLYSSRIKTVATADVMTLAVLYTLRVLAGAAATGIILSSWLLAFSVFVFVSLAYLKRYIELAALEAPDAKVHGRHYYAADTDAMFSLGTANMTASVLVLALFIQSEAARGTYNAPEALWFLCLFMLYWGNRIWLKAKRGEVHDDPVVYAVKDRVSQAIAGLFLLAVLVAKYASF